MVTKVDEQLEPSFQPKSVPNGEIDYLIPVIGQCMAYSHFDVDRDGKVLHLTINRPDTLNAFAELTWDEFRSALVDADSDPDCRVVILSGKGRAFSAGDDINDLEFTDVPEAEIREYTEMITESIFTVERIDTPVIAKVDGIAYGGGCEMAALCDVTIASEESRFRQPEPLLGNVAGIALSRFPALIGLKRTRELLLTTRELDGREAYEIGLVNEVVPEDEIDDVVEDRAQQIVRTAPLASTLMKQQLNEELSFGLAALNANTFLFGTDDMAEGVSAFFEDREPNWQGT